MMSGAHQIKDSNVYGGMVHDPDGFFAALERALPEGFFDKRKNNCVFLYAVICDQWYDQETVRKLKLEYPDTYQRSKRYTELANRLSPKRFPDGPRSMHTWFNQNRSALEQAGFTYNTDGDSWTIYAPGYRTAPPLLKLAQKVDGLERITLAVPRETLEVLNAYGMRPEVALQQAATFLQAMVTSSEEGGR